eukprot:scaffold78145_cov36-Prasinocladus_malaysianus.AAC.3
MNRREMTANHIEEEKSNASFFIEAKLRPSCTLKLHTNARKKPKSGEIARIKRSDAPRAHKEFAVRNYHLELTVTNEKDLVMFKTRLAAIPNLIPTCELMQDNKRGLSFVHPCCCEAATIALKESPYLGRLGLVGLGWLQSGGCALLSGRGSGQPVPGWALTRVGGDHGSRRSVKRVRGLHYGHRRGRACAYGGGRLPGELRQRGIRGLGQRVEGQDGPADLHHVRQLDVEQVPPVVFALLGGLRERYLKATRRHESEAQGQGAGPR